MGLFDSIRDRLAGRDDDYYDDDEYYEDEQEEQVEEHGLLGNTSRPEAESVSVYTRSGRPLSGAANAEREESEARSVPRGVYAEGYVPSQTSSVTPPLQSTPKLPPYVLKPVSYEDVQTVVRRVRTLQPVVLVFLNTNIEVAKRILDFSYGFAMGSEGSVEELGDRVFCVLPKGRSLGQSEIDKLVADGDLAR